MHPEDFLGPIWQKRSIDAQIRARVQRLTLETFKVNDSFHQGLRLNCLLMLLGAEVLADLRVPKDVLGEFGVAHECIKYDLNGVHCALFERNERFEKVVAEQNFVFSFLLFEQ